jgi:exo-1,4-beta-D-glucosaminidase
VEEAQVQNYETQRAEFEAYIAHSTRRRAPSTGIVYWQLNKGWPTLLWDLYNYDSDQAGSYFGAKKANERLHVLYTYDDGTVSVDNLGSALESGLSVQARVYDAAGDLLSSQRSRTLSVPPQGVASRLLKPRVPAGTKPPAPARTYFVELLLRRGRNLIDRNVYWLSTQPDVVDWSRTIGLPQATMSRYASLVGLHALPRATLAVRARTHSAPGPDGADRDTELTITNTSRTRTVAFFIRGDLRRGTASGKAVLSALWSDNDITLWPGESQTLSVRYRGSDLKGSRPVVTVGAWNITRAAVIAH